MTLANKKKTVLFVLLALLTFAAFYSLTAFSIAVIQLAEFIFALFAMGGEAWLK